MEGERIYYSQRNMLFTILKQLSEEGVNFIKDGYPKAYEVIMNRWGVLSMKYAIGKASDEIIDTLRGYISKNYIDESINNFGSEWARFYKKYQITFSNDRENIYFYFNDKLELTVPKHNQ